MRRLSKEMQMVYDYCEMKKKNLDDAVEKIGFKNNPSAAMLLSDQSTCYWAVQQFIEVNFMGSQND